MPLSRYPAKSFWQSLALIVVPAAALVGIEVYQATAILPDLVRGQAALAHTFQVIDTARTLDQSIQDAERGQRGFLITGDPKYLEPYTAAETAASAKLSQLKKLTEDNPEQQPRIDLIQHQMNLRFSELKRQIDARRAEGFEASRQIIMTNTGYDAMRVLTELIDSATNAEHGLLTQRQAQTDEIRGNAVLMSMVAAALALATIILGIILLIVNLNRAAKAQETSAESEERFRLLVNGVRDYAMYILDPTGYVASWNEGAEHIKGYTAEEIIGRHFSLFYTPEDIRAGVPDRHLDAAAREGRYQEEGWRVRKDGSRFCADALITALYRPDGSLRGFAKITRDVTERRNQQTAFEQSQAALAQAQKMEAVGQLTGGVAHDFNNLLTAIQGSLELLDRQRKPIDSATLDRLIGPARSAAERAAVLTNRLLAFSRQQALSPQDIDINRHVGGMSELLRRVLGESVAIETVLAGGLWRCVVDPNQLENTLLNLAVNARDAMPDGGKLTIETGNTFLDEEYAAAHEEVVPGQYVMIAVSDTGTGMTSETMAHALEPFFTTKESGRGTGLGLSQVYGFVKQSGGHIKLYSEVGQGTTVKIYMPRHVSASASPERLFDQAEPILAGDSEIVLLVEDDPDVREFGAAALAHLGYHVLEAADASTALTLLERHSNLALLLTDVGLPGINGRQLAEEARRRVPGLRVVYMTGYARNAIVHGGVLDAGVDLLPKPFTAEGLGRKLQEVMRRD